MTKRALLAASAVVAIAVLVVTQLVGEEERVDPYLTFVTAHLDVVGTQPAPVSSDARFSREIAKVTELDSVDPALDACAGPVAVYLGKDYPWLVAEHDYCGGSSWIPMLEESDVVQLAGPGVAAGLYVTQTITDVPRYDSTLADLPDGDVVLQTCISRTRMVLVALELAAPIDRA